VESVDVLNRVGINSGSFALIVVTQHYDTLQAIGAYHPNLILLPNSPQAGSDVNNMVASFTASNMVGESMKKKTVEKAKNSKKISMKKKRKTLQKQMNNLYHHITKKRPSGLFLFIIQLIANGTTTFNMFPALKLL
jgi:hypothetical protein